MHSGCNQAKVSEHAYPFVYKQNGGSRSTSSPGPSPLRFSKWRRRRAAILKIAEEKALGTRLGSRSCRTVVVEIRYISAQNVVLHTENCKLEFLLECSVTQVEKNIRRMCGVDESNRRRGFPDFALEMFYIDFIEGGISKKPPLCLELKKELEMFQRNSCTSLPVKVIQSQVIFQKGSVRPVNIVFKQRSPSVPETEEPRSCTSSGKQLPQEKIVNKSTDSGSDK